MGIDEAIYIAQNIICDEVIGTYCTEIQKEGVNCSKNCKSEDCYLFQAIETLINEYNNLKQIEEAHRIENGKLREEIKDLKTELYMNSVSKDKIRAKIEELDALKHNDNRLDRVSVDFSINKFKELLEEK